MPAMPPQNPPSLPGSVSEGASVGSGVGVAVRDKSPGETQPNTVNAAAKTNKNSNPFKLIRAARHLISGKYNFQRGY